MNNKPWLQQKELDTNTVRKILEDNLPNINIHSVKELGNGWDNTTWLINSDQVLRLPKHAEGGLLLRNEMRILPQLSNLTVDYPKPELICNEPKGYDFPFYLHRYLSGTNADRAQLNETDRIKLARPLAIFLKQLHAFSIEKAQALGVEVDRIERVNAAKRFPKTCERLDYLVQHHLIESKDCFVNEIEKYLDMTIPNELVLGHGDFYAKHLLLDSDKNLCAVIDWGDCELLSPAVDLRIVYQFLPLAAHESFWNSYGNVDPSIRILARLGSIYSAATIAWYAHQVQEMPLLNEGLLGLNYLKASIKLDV